MKNTIKTCLCSLVLVLSALLISACGVGLRSQATPTPVKGPGVGPRRLDLTIVHTGKVYGEILPCG